MDQEGMCMLNRSTKRFVARVLILTLVFSAFGVFNLGALAQNNKVVTPQVSGAQSKTPQSKTPQSKTSQLSGQLIARGPVTVNGNKVISGTTIFTDSVIAVDCAKGNSAIINLGKLGHVELVAGAKMILRFSDKLISGDLQEGKAIIHSQEGVKVDVSTPTGPVTANCQQSCITPVAVQDFVQCTPVVAAAPVAPPPLPSHGVRWWPAAILGAGAVGG